MPEKCPKCESEKWMTGLHLNEVISAADTFTLKDIFAQHITLKTVSVCADCGYAEFKAVCRDGIWEEWKKANA